MSSREITAQRFTDLLELIKSQSEKMSHDWAKQITTRDTVFVISVSSSFDRYSSITPSQQKVFENIENKYLNGTVLEECAWYENYSPEQRERAEVAAHYYAALGTFYRDLASKIIGDKKFIPSPKQYKSIVENKYAAKVIEEHYKEPLYKEQTLVEIRNLKSAPITSFLSYPGNAIRPNLFYHYGGMTCLVLKTKVIPIRSSCKGASQYLVLPIGKQEPIIVEERFIKKHRKK